MKLKVVKLKDSEQMQILFENKGSKEYAFHCLLAEPSEYTNATYTRRFNITDARELIEYLEETFPKLKEKILPIQELVGT